MSEEVKKIKGRREGDKEEGEEAKAKQIVQNKIVLRH